MKARAWQSPPMHTKPAIVVDENVVRQILTINPELGRGRTPAQVKRALESGEAVGVASAKDAPVAAASGLAETLGFFLSGKTMKLRADLASLAARRQALDDEAV